MRYMGSDTIAPGFEFNFTDRRKRYIRIEFDMQMVLLCAFSGDWQRNKFRRCYEFYCPRLTMPREGFQLLSDWMDGETGLVINSGNCPSSCFVFNIKRVIIIFIKQPMVSPRIITRRRRLLPGKNVIYAKLHWISDRVFNFPREQFTRKSVSLGVLPVHHHHHLHNHRHLHQLLQCHTASRLICIARPNRKNEHLELIRRIYRGGVQDYQENSLLNWLSGPSSPSAVLNQIQGFTAYTDW